MCIYIYILYLYLYTRSIRKPCLIKMAARVFLRKECHPDLSNVNIGNLVVTFNSYGILKLISLSKKHLEDEDPTFVQLQTAA